ncbi:MAG: hypothetical protein GF399_11960 [Candidatus Coatesbacteria bacterium]|nr:hypothetical protein [Candidatus Coatesbacteria bacterium]
MSYINAVEKKWFKLFTNTKNFEVFAFRKRGLNKSLYRIHADDWIEFSNSVFWRITIDEVAESFKVFIPTVLFKFYRLKHGDRSRISLDCHKGIADYQKCRDCAEYHIDYYIRGDEVSASQIILNPISTNALEFMQFVIRLANERKDPFYE